MQSPLASSLPPFSAWLEDTNDITQQFLAIGGDPAMVSLAGGLPAPELYPCDEVRAATERALLRWGPQALEYGPVEGLPALRAALAARVSADTGAILGAENVLVTTGAMQGLDLMGKALLDKSELVISQFPTYLGALDAWRPRAPRYLPLDWHGGASEKVLKQAKFVYAVPNFSNPTGVLVPTEQRAALLRQVRGAGTWLLEDDPYRALQYDGAPLPTLLALDAHDRGSDPYDGPVIHLGTFSKTIAPGLRIGWVIARADVIRTLARVKMSTDLSGCMFTQSVALQLLEEGVDRRLEPVILNLYRERRDVLCEHASAQLSDWFEWQVPPGGMFVWMRALDARMDTDVLYRHALAERVAFVPSSVFDPASTLKSAMRVNFTRAGPERIREGISRLARATSRYLATLA